MRQFAVIGLGEFGLSVARTLANEGCEVIAIDKREDKIQEISDVVTHAVQVDATDEKALRSLGIPNVDVAIISIGEKIQASILIALVLKELGVKHIVAKAITSQQGKILEKIGVDRVVYPEIDMGERVARSLLSSKIKEQIALFSEGHSIMEIEAPSTFIGKTLRELDVRAKFKVNVIAIKRHVTKVNAHGEFSKVEKVDITPNPDDVISSGDILLVFGDNEGINRLRRQ